MLTPVSIAIKLKFSPLGNCEKWRWCEHGTNRMPIRTDTPQTVSVMFIPIADYREIVPVSSINPSSSGRLQISYHGPKVSKMQNRHAGGCWSRGLVELSHLLPGFPGCCGCRLRTRLNTLSCGFSSDFWSNSGWDQSSIKLILDNETVQFPLKSSVLAASLSVCHGKPLEMHTLEKGKTCLLTASEFSVSGCLTPLLSLVRQNIMAGDACGKTAEKGERGIMGWGVSYRKVCILQRFQSFLRPLFLSYDMVRCHI